MAPPAPLTRGPNSVSQDFIGSYLAGLFEGDGHIWIPKSTLSKKHNPRFCITFNIKDFPLAPRACAWAPALGPGQNIY